MFKYTYEDIDKDIKAHIEKGCFPFCHTPSYFEPLKNTLEIDIKAIEALCPGFKGQHFFVEDIIDHKRSTERKLAFKNIDLKKLNGTFGNVNYLIDTNFLEHEVKISEGTFKSSRNKKEFFAIFKLGSRTPIDAAQTVYHEYAHILQRHFKYFSSSQNKNQAYSALRERSNEEAHANAFSCACVLLKKDLDPSLEKYLLQNSARDFINIIERPNQSRDFLYPDYPAIKEVFKNLRENQEKYYNTNGSINFQALSNMVAVATKDKSYSLEAMENLSETSFSNLKTNGRLGKMKKIHSPHPHISPESQKHLEEHATVWKKDLKEAKKLFIPQKQTKKTFTLDELKILKSLCMLELYTDLRHSYDRRASEHCLKQDYYGLVNDELKEYNNLYNKTKEKEKSTQKTTSPKFRRGRVTHSIS